VSWPKTAWEHAFVSHGTCPANVARADHRRTRITAGIGAEEHALLAAAGRPIPAPGSTPGPCSTRQGNTKTPTHHGVTLGRGAEIAVATSPMGTLDPERAEAPVRDFLVSYETLCDAVTQPIGAQERAAESANPFKYMRQGEGDYCHLIRQVEISMQSSPIRGRPTAPQRAGERPAWVRSSVRVPLRDSNPHPLRPGRK
jgi:hypothetical protein